MYAGFAWRMVEQEQLIDFGEGQRELTSRADFFFFYLFFFLSGTPRKPDGLVAITLGVSSPASRALGGWLDLWRASWG